MNRHVVKKFSLVFVNTLVKEKLKLIVFIEHNELSRIALERASSARDAISIIGELATMHGFYGPHNEALILINES